jgi:hypothetical protein
MSSNLGETAKKLILVCWEKARQPPPPHSAWIWRLSHMEKRQIESPKRQNG